MRSCQCIKLQKLCRSRRRGLVNRASGYSSRRFHVWPSQVPDSHGPLIAGHLEDGVGKLGLATTLTISKDGTTLELENDDIQPIALNEMRRAGK